MTMQATVLNSFKQNKAFKMQAQQNPVTEEEEENHGTDESVDEEAVYLSNQRYSILSQTVFKFTRAILEIIYQSHTSTILIPPPKF